MISQALADGILTGAIIALGAIGVTFTLGIMRFANFAHSELLTWGAYIAFVVVAFAGPGTPTGPLSFGWQLLAAALVAAVLTGLAAWAVDTPAGWVEAFSDGAVGAGGAHVAESSLAVRSRSAAGCAASAVAAAGGQRP